MIPVKKRNKAAKLSQWGAGPNPARVSSLLTSDAWKGVEGRIQDRIAQDKQNHEASVRKYSHDLLLTAHVAAKAKAANLFELPEDSRVAIAGEVYDTCKKAAKENPRDRGVQTIAKAAETVFKKSPESWVTVGQLKAWRATACTANQRETEAVDSLLTDSMAGIARFDAHQAQMGKMAKKIVSQQDFDQVCAIMGITTDRVDHRLARAYLARMVNEKVAQEAAPNMGEGPTGDEPKELEPKVAADFHWEDAAVEIGEEGVICMLPNGMVGRVHDDGGAMRWVVTNDNGDVQAEGHAETLEGGKGEVQEWWQNYSSSHQTAEEEPSIKEATRIARIQDSWMKKADLEMVKAGDHFALLGPINGQISSTIYGSDGVTKVAEQMFATMDEAKAVTAETLAKIGQFEDEEMEELEEEEAGISHEECEELEEMLLGDYEIVEHLDDLNPKGVILSLDHFEQEITPVSIEDMGNVHARGDSSNEKVGNDIWSLYWILENLARGKIKKLDGDVNQELVEKALYA